VVVDYEYDVSFEPAAAVGKDEILDEGLWPDRLNRLLSRGRMRAAVVVACAVAAVSTFGGTRVYEQLAAPAVAPAVSPASPPTRALLPFDASVCTDETVYVQDPNHPGVRPYEVTFCPSVAPPPLPPQHAGGHHLR
jgi:hypothetical protein